MSELDSQKIPAGISKREVIRRKKAGEDVSFRVTHPKPKWQLEKLKNGGGNPDIHKFGFKPGQSGNPAGQFKPGQSGNPSGRAKSQPIKEAMTEMLAAPYVGKNKRYRDRNFTNAQALAATQLRLAIEAGDMRAAEELANRTEGKVLSVTQLQGVNGGPIEIAAMTPEEKRARIQQLLYGKELPGA